jgi:hypothetical protein
MLKNFLSSIFNPAKKTHDSTNTLFSGLPPHSQPETELESINNVNYVPPVYHDEEKDTSTNPLLNPENASFVTKSINYLLQEAKDNNNDLGIPENVLLNKAKCEEVVIDIDSLKTVKSISNGGQNHIIDCEHKSVRRPCFTCIQKHVNCQHLAAGNFCRVCVMDFNTRHGPKNKLAKHPKIKIPNSPQPGAPSESPSTNSKSEGNSTSTTSKQTIDRSASPYWWNMSQDEKERWWFPLPVPKYDPKKHTSKDPGGTDWKQASKLKVVKTSNDDWWSDFISTVNGDGPCDPPPDGDDPEPLTPPPPPPPVPPPNGRDPPIYQKLYKGNFLLDNHDNRINH